MLLHESWELLRDGESHPCTWLLSYCALQQSTVIYFVRNASPDHIRATLKPATFLKQASAKRSPRCRYTRRRPSGRKRVKRDSFVKRTHLHLPVRQSGADQRTDSGHEDHSHAIDFAQFLEKARRPVSRKHLTRHSIVETLTPK